MATDTTTSAPSSPLEVYYPESDGLPMGETGIHAEAMMDLIIALRDWFAADPLVNVSGNQFLYFVEHNPKRVLCPDVMVARGLDKTLRDIFKTWEEGPWTIELVIEVSSRSTRRDDIRKKHAMYRDDLRVREYVLFDPLKEKHAPPLRGFRLVGDEYLPIPLVDGRLPCESLGLHLQIEGQTLRLFDPLVGQIVPNRLEQVQRLEETTRTLEESNRELRERDQQRQAEMDRLLRELAAFKAGQKQD